MSYHGWQEVVGTVGLVGAFAAVITIVIWHMATTWRARAILARDHQYRTLAEQATRSHDSAVQQLAGIDERLADLQTRMRSVERILKEVE
ncbi:hypothetical protein ACIP4Y_22330 [Streptomyces sp. NPDC088810]|uniref:hypothetical protein n=1 Tax=unclassified Streptomyces TaxID=2593676 RepID=UPI0004C07B96|nr:MULTISPECIES: hypothetical protein [unclassified Streptomyces]KOV91945.1 hypothetical protein ADL04_32565 [Streptomyces sp. NRRL B-3648]